MLYIFYKLKMRIVHKSSPITSKGGALILDFLSQPEHHHLIKLHCNFIAGITNCYVINTVLSSKRLAGQSDIIHGQFIFYLGWLIKLVGKNVGPMKKDTDVWILHLFWVFDSLEQKIIGEVFFKYSIFQHSRCGKKNATAQAFAPS